jgi:hypothetical protein
LIFLPCCLKGEQQQEELSVGKSRRRRQTRNATNLALIGGSRRGLGGNVRLAHADLASNRFLFGGMILLIAFSIAIAVNWSHSVLQKKERSGRKKQTRRMKEAEAIKEKS